MTPFLLFYLIAGLVALAGWWAISQMFERSGPPTAGRVVWYFIVLYGWFVLIAVAVGAVS